MENQRSGNFCSGKFSWLGFPDDLGVKNVKGRVGAREGPARAWQYFEKLKGKNPVLQRLDHQHMLLPGEDLSVNHQAAADLVCSSIQDQAQLQNTLIVVGGGHDYAYPWLKGFRSHFAPDTRIGCINIDAHFDLRDPKPLMSSGAPFRRAIEENLLSGKDLIEFGIQAHCNGPELWQFAFDHQIEIIPFEDCRNGMAVSNFQHALHRLSLRCDVILLSLDLDALNFAFAPGVSAPQGEGFTSSEIYQILEFAGAESKVASLGVFELCPQYDVHDLTSRLAAQATWHFLNSKLF